MPSASCLVPTPYTNGRSRIRTCEGVSQRVYSPPRLSTPAPAPVLGGVLYRPGRLASSGTTQTSRLTCAKSHRGDSNPQPAVYKTESYPRSQTGIGGTYTTNTLRPDSSTTPNESDTGCRDLKPDLKPGRLSNAQPLIDRGVAPDVADFLVKCARAGRVVDVIKQFDRWGHSPADPAGWFQEMLLHDTHDRNLSRFGRRIRQAPKSSGPSKRQPLPKGRRRRSRKRKLRRPTAA